MKRGAAIIFFVLAQFIARPVFASDTLYFLHTDHLGSTRVVTDQTGNQVASYDYYPYGSINHSARQPSDHLAREPGAFGGGSGKAIERLYTSQIRDASADLYFYNARYYNPEIGTFISADSAQGPNRYAYVLGKPINMVDPSGNQGDEAEQGEDPYPVYLPLILKTQAIDYRALGYPYIKYPLEKNIFEKIRFWFVPDEQRLVFDPATDDYLCQFLARAEKKLYWHLGQPPSPLSIVQFVQENVEVDESRYQDFDGYIRDKWESLRIGAKIGDQMAQGKAACLEWSILTMALLKRHGYENVQLLSLRGKPTGVEGMEVGHVVVRLEYNDQVWILDSINPEYLMEQENWFFALYGDEWREVIPVEIE